MRPLAYVAPLSVLALAACEREPHPLAPEAATVTAAAESAAITATTFFALEVLDLPSSEAVASYDINDAGQVFGIMRAADGTGDRDFFFDPTAGDFIEIPKEPTIGLLFGGSMNELGMVAGTTNCATAGCVRSPYTWTASGGVVQLTTGHARSSASEINDAGSVTGDSGPSSGPWHAARWLADGTFEELDLAGLVSSDAFSRARGINDSGHIVVSGETDGGSIPMLWTPSGGTVRLTALEAAIAAVAPGDILSVVPQRINDAGDILGFWRSTGADQRNPFVWTAEGTLVDFNSMGGFGDVLASGQNDLGEVVFTIIDGTFPDRTMTPWFWSAEAGFIRLPTLDPHSTWAAAINNNGVIVGTSDVTPIVWRPLTSADDALDELEDTLDDVLGGGGVDVEGGNGLDAKLDRIREHLEAGRAHAARNQLEAFVNQVEAMMADGRLSADDGSALLAAASALSGLLT
jgi:uncharacterized membrane protein